MNNRKAQEDENGNRMCEEATDENEAALTGCVWMSGVFGEGKSSLQAALCGILHNGSGRAGRLRVEQGLPMTGKLPSLTSESRAGSCSGTALPQPPTLSKPNVQRYISLFLTAE